MAYELPFGGATKTFIPPQSLEPKCPVCRDEMAEEEERYCEQCGRKVCWGCAIPYDVRDMLAPSQRGACYFICRKCTIESSKVLRRGAGFYAAGVPCGSVTPAPLRIGAAK